MGFGILNFVFALPAVWFIDTWGRRSLLLLTFPFMAIFEFGAGISFLASKTGKFRTILVAIFCYLFTIAYSIGEGPIPFVGNSVFF
jgi:predicted MFS family arabinose efflux permease